MFVARWAPTQGDILRQVLVEGLRFAAVGVVMGTVLSIVAGRALRQLLYEVRAYDAPTLAGTCVSDVGDGGRVSGAGVARVRVAPKVALDES